MKKKVFVGGMHHESDTFNPIVTGENDIWVLRGQALLENISQSSVCGVIQTLEGAGYEVVPGLIARAVPNGEWDREFFLKLKDEFIDALKKALPVDALCLSLHGSMRVRDLGEAEGIILKEVRALCPDIPIISTLDMHATVSSDMVRNADGFVGYKCAPHTDTYETGVHAAKMTIRALEEGFVPRMAAVHLPFLIAGEQSETSVQPMKKLISALREYEKKPHVMAASYLLGFPWADVRENGVTALVVSDNDQKTADEGAMELARLFWNTRHEFGFYNETREVPEAIEQAWLSIQAGVYPVVLSDSGDNPTAGSSQDVTNFLQAILADGRLASLDPPLCYQGFYDPELCARAMECCPGEFVEGTLGAAFDRVTSKPVKVHAKVKATVKAWKHAQYADLALIDVCGVDVVVTSKHVGCYDPEMMEALGVDCGKCKAIVVKLGYLEPEIRAVARRSLMVLTDGSTNEIFSRLPYRKLARPIFPLEPDTQCSFDFIGR